MVAIVAGCGASPKPETAGISPAPFAFRLIVRATPDSAARQVRFALGSTKGALQQPTVQGDAILLSARTSRERMNGGHREVSYLAAISRVMRDSTTSIEISAWGLDIEPERVGLTATGRGTRDLPTITSSSPTTVSGSQRQPFRITVSDKIEWALLEEIVAAMLDTGAEFAKAPGGPAAER